MNTVLQVGRSLLNLTEVTLNVDAVVRDRGLIASCEVHFIQRRESFLRTVQCQRDFAVSNPLYIATVGTSRSFKSEKRTESRSIKLNK